MGILWLQLYWGRVKGLYSRISVSHLRATPSLTCFLCYLFHCWRFVWPSQEQPPTCPVSSHSDTGARPTGPAPLMATRSPGAQQSEFSPFSQWCRSTSIFCKCCSILWTLMGLWLRCLRFVLRLFTKWLITIVFIYRVDIVCFYWVYLHAGWTGMETISLETGETATLPPVCRGTTTTESEKFK